MTTFEEVRLMIDGIRFGIQGLGIGQFLKEGACLPSVTQDLSAIKTSGLVPFEASALEA